MASLLDFSSVSLRLLRRLLRRLLCRLLHRLLHRRDDDRRTTSWSQSASSSAAFSTPCRQGTSCSGPCDCHLSSLFQEVVQMQPHMLLHGRLRREFPGPLSIMMHNFQKVIIRNVMLLKPFKSSNVDHAILNWLKRQCLIPFNFDIDFLNTYYTYYTMIIYIF